MLVNEKESNLHGFLLVNKPPQMTSFSVVARIRSITGQKSVGHCGTLDPFAEGLLVISLGVATKLSSFFLGSSKYYRAQMRFGMSTDSGDCDGQIVGKGPLPSKRKLIDTMDQVKGSYLQRAPAFSAVKHKGKKLYELARKGQKIPEIHRPVLVKDLKIVEMTEETDENISSLIFETECSAGTYVRVMAQDWAIASGSSAYLTALDRLKSGCFQKEESIQLDKIEFQKIKDHVSFFPILDPRIDAFHVIEIDRTDAKYFSHGHQKEIQNFIQHQISQQLESKGSKPVLISWQNQPLALIAYREKQYVLQRVLMPKPLEFSG